jgi:hypothetical protein
MRLQRVARQQCSRLAERDVAGGLAAAQDVVVHARQIVVDERVGVDYLHRRRGTVDDGRIRARHLSGGIGQERPHTLAAPQHGIAHRLVEIRQRARLRRERAVEHVLDAPLAFLRPDGEGEVRVHRCRPRG